MSSLACLFWGLLLPVRVLINPPIRLVDFFAPPVSLSAVAEAGLGTNLSLVDRLKIDFFFCSAAGTPAASADESTADAGSRIPADVGAAAGGGARAAGRTSDAFSSTGATSATLAGSAGGVASPVWSGSAWPAFGLVGGESGRGVDVERSKVGVCGLSGSATCAWRLVGVDIGCSMRGAGGGVDGRAGTSSTIGAGSSADGGGEGVCDVGKKVRDGSLIMARERWRAGGCWVRAK